MSLPVPQMPRSWTGLPGAEVKPVPAFSVRKADTAPRPPITELTGARHPRLGDPQEVGTHLSVGRPSPVAGDTERAV